MVRLFEKAIINILDGTKSERPFSVKSSSSQRDGGWGVLSSDSISIASVRPTDNNPEALRNKNSELKEELHKSRANNGILRSRLAKKDREIEDLRNKNWGLLEKIESMEKVQQRHQAYIESQERHITGLQTQLEATPSPDLEKEELQKSLEEVINVKMKYENILKLLVQNPEVKPIIANLFN